MSSTLPRVSSMRLTVSGSGGPPVVFVHGWACDATDWRDQIDALEARTTVVAGDLPGHGRSPAGLVECTIAACGASLSAALRELSLPPAILVGHSMGCRVVLEATRVMPDSVCGLVLVDGSRIADGDPEVAVRAMADELVGDGYRRFVRDFFEAMFVPSSDPVLAKSIVDRALRLPAEVGRSLICDGAGWDAREMVNALDAVRVPLLAIQSTALDPTSASLVACWPEFSLAGFGPRSGGGSRHRGDPWGRSLSADGAGRRGQRTDHPLRAVLTSLISCGESAKGTVLGRRVRVLASRKATSAAGEWPRRRWVEFHSAS